MVVDFRRAQSDHSPLFIDGSPVEIVKSTKFLGVHLAENFTWSLNSTSITKKAQQRLYFLRRLRKAHLPPPILTMFYRGTIESVLSSCITAWFGNCTVLDLKTLQRIVRTAEKIIGVSLPSITDMYTRHCICKANSIVDDPTHPSHTLFILLPSGKSWNVGSGPDTMILIVGDVVHAFSTRLLKSFFRISVCLSLMLFVPAWRTTAPMFLFRIAGTCAATSRTGAPGRQRVLTLPLAAVARTCRTMESLSISQREVKQFRVETGGGRGGEVLAWGLCLPLLLLHPGCVVPQNLGGPRPWCAGPGQRSAWS
ncbi:hypothetical protein QTP86_012932 [Hemibagrus guttatus]|nr:hypothetical protein QTP86_012932 [Hemibagrus guttatus]